MQEDTHFLPGLSPVGPVEIHARFDGGALSSDGGVLILREIDTKVDNSRTFLRPAFMTPVMRGGLSMLTPR